MRNQLRRYYQRAGYTRETLAAALRISPSHLSRIANRRVAPSEGLERLIGALLDLEGDEYNDAFGYPVYRPGGSIIRIDERRGQAGRHALVDGGKTTTSTGRAG